MEAIMKLASMNVTIRGAKLVKSVGDPYQLCWPLVSSVVKSARCVSRAVTSVYRMAPTVWLLLVTPSLPCSSWLHTSHLC